MDSGNVWCLPWQQMCRSLLPVCDGFGDNLLCRFLIPTYLLSSYRKEKEKKGGGEADCEKGIGASCLLNCFLMSRGVVNFGV